MASCVRDRELLCVSSTYSDCQSRHPYVTHGLTTQGCPMSAGQDWAILRLQELSLTLSSLPQNGLATYTVCSAGDPTITALVQREGKKCLFGPESSSSERHSSYISTSPRKVRHHTVASMRQKDSYRFAQRPQERVGE